MAKQLWLNPDGSLALNADGTVIFDEQTALEDCCCTSPCEFPDCDGDCYHIVGFSGFDTSCIGTSGADTHVGYDEWNGEVRLLTTGVYYWLDSTGSSPATFYVVLSYVTLRNDIDSAGDPVTPGTDCTYELVLKLYDNSLSPAYVGILWRGTRDFDGNCPIGEFNKVEGCLDVDVMTLEYCPS